MAECAARWLPAAEHEAAWERLRSAPAPAGYDPVIAWPDGPGSADFAVLELTPWRLRTWQPPQPPVVWRGATPGASRARPSARGDRQGSARSPSPRRPALTKIVACASALPSRSVGSGRRCPSGLMPPTTYPVARSAALGSAMAARLPSALRSSRAATGTDARRDGGWGLTPGRVGAKISSRTLIGHAATPRDDSRRFTSVGARSGTAAIFRDNVDRMTYLRHLGRTDRLMAWRCLSYCLMGNTSTCSSRHRREPRRRHAAAPSVRADLQRAPRPEWARLPVPLWVEADSRRRAVVDGRGVHRTEPGRGRVVRAAGCVALEQPRGRDGRCRSAMARRGAPARLLLHARRRPAHSLSRRDRRRLRRVSRRPAGRPQPCP